MMSRGLGKTGCFNLHIQVSVCPYVVKAASLGLCQVWEKSSPQLSDYVSITVGSVIQPTQATVTLGDLVCFSSPLLTQTGNYSNPGHHHPADGGPCLLLPFILLC